MSTLAQELSALKTAEDKITGNKVANFAYDDYAYEHDDANGVDVYDVNNHQNIPNGTANILKVNPTILTKGWRAQASAITRMLLDHFLGRCSYNLNKVNDHFSSLLTTLGNYLGVANGIATLDSSGKVPNSQLRLGDANGIATLDTNGYVPTAQLSPTGVVKTVNSHTPSNGNVDVSKSDVGLGSVVNTGDSATPVSGGTTKFTTGGAYTELAKKVDTTRKVNGHALSADVTVTKSDVGLGSVVNTGDSATPVSGGTTKFTTGGAYTELAKKAPKDHTSTTTEYGSATEYRYGHVKLGRMFEPREMFEGSTIDLSTYGVYFNNTSASLNIYLSNPTSSSIKVVYFTIVSGTVTVAVQTYTASYFSSVSIASNACWIILPEIATYTIAI